MLATVGDLPRAADAHVWGFEMKWDGMRAVAEVRPDGWRVVGRSGKDATASFPDLAGPGGLADLSDRLGGRVLVLDGEIVATDDRGVPSFSKLQQRMNVSRPDPKVVAGVPVTYLVFDVLEIDGVPAMDLAYRDRRRLLDGLDLAAVAGEHGRIQVPPVIEGDAEQAWHLAESMDLEGVVAKRLDCPYLPGKRATGWRKIKRLQEREVILVGWAEGEGRRAGGLGALVLAVPAGPAATAPATTGSAGASSHDSGTDVEPNALRLVGRVGTGFTDAMLDHLLALLRPLERPTPPVPGAPSGAQARGVHWVEPELVGEVSFTEWTVTDSLRHPVWRGLRPDKHPSEVPPLEPR